MATSGFEYTYGGQALRVAPGLSDTTGFEYAFRGQALRVLAAPEPVYEQEGFRWRNDDGDEDAATWAASQDTDITAAAGQVRRLRILTNVTNNPPAKALKLQYRRVGDTTWTDLGGPY